MNGIELKAGAVQRADARLEIGSVGCCEYAAAPLNVEGEDYIAKKKLFTHTVGEAKDYSTLRGIAEPVYGDSNLWIQIFEANRCVLDKPGAVPSGTALEIPPRKREVPKVISKVMPACPPQAAKQHISGDVVMGVTVSERRHGRPGQRDRR